MDDDINDLAGSDGVSIHTGFPNPGLDQRSRGRPLALDLNQLLIERPSSTYLFRISGHNWADQGVFDGDIAIVDRARGAGVNDLIITWQASGFTVLRRQHLTADQEMLGVITAIVHRFGEE